MTEIEQSNLGEKDKPPPSTSEQLCRRFSLAEIQSATQNFDDALVIGQGGFGKVYKGFIDGDASTVAIKRLNSVSQQGAPEFWTEIEMLSKFRHCHLVSLIGYCDNGLEMILVYEYISNGTLADHLHKIGKEDNSLLSWVQRLKICIGAARGLDYLHTGTSVQHRVIHRDVKSSNILLDENWAAKISDFGLSKLGPVNQSFSFVSTNVKGTIGYMDPEYFSTGRLTRKSDVYAFGVVLFEVLCGRRAVDRTLNEEQWSLAGWAQRCIKKGTIDQIIDPSLRGQILPKCLMKFTQIADQCLHSSPKKRPTMAEVVVWLEFALALQESTDSSIKPAWVTFTTKVRQFFVGTTGMTSVPSDGNPSRNGKGNIRNDGSSALPNKGGGVILEEQIVAPNVKVFKFAELKSATKNFGPDMLLGEGHFGKIFKGWVNEKTYAPSKVGVGMAVAIKRLIPDGLQLLKERQIVELLGKCHHPNLVNFLGYCFAEDNKFLLVHEYIQNGSLENHLYRKTAEPLPWVTRIKIAMGAARGLAFLHTIEKRAMYLSYEASNILLDADFNAKLSDFGLAELDIAINECLVPDLLYYHPIVRPNRPIRGSPYYVAPYYVAPEYFFTDNLYVQSDVYGFGLVLLEILTGRRASERNLPRGQNLKDWAKPFLHNKRKVHRIMDARLENKYPLRGAFKVAALVLKCLDLDLEKRPSMEKVLEILEKINAIEDGTQ